MTFFVPASPDDKKFVELLIYVATKSRGDEKFGATKLNKTLFYADFLSYRATGKSITGHRYKKLDKGPVPKAIVPILSRLKQSGDVHEVPREYFGKQQNRIVPNREADLSVFTPDEVSLIDSVLEYLKDESATGVSNLSHEFVGWKAASLNEEIPYQTALIDDSPDLDDFDFVTADALKEMASQCLSK